MREILFRGKKKLGSLFLWVEGDLLHTTVDRELRIRSFDLNCAGVYDVIPETVGQFTGKTDKNGKRIFEGDIVKGSWNTIFVVYYDEEYLQFRAKKADGYARELDYYGESHDCEVIGNIHDNPELMKGAQ